jgi:hypothetical protein
MDWKDMITGGKAALMLLVFTVGAAIMIAINSFVGLFIGGSLQTAAINSSFYYVNASNTSQGLTTVGSGFNSTVGYLITNIGAVQTPFALWTNLLSVILVLAVFAGFVYLGYQAYKKGKEGGSGEGMGY